MRDVHHEVDDPQDHAHRVEHLDPQRLFPQQVVGKARRSRWCRAAVRGACGPLSMSARPPCASCVPYAANGLANARLPIRMRNLRAGVGRRRVGHGLCPAGPTCADRRNLRRPAHPSNPSARGGCARQRPKSRCLFADRRVIRRSVRNLPCPRAKGGQRGATNHRDAHWTVDHRRTISARVSERPRTDPARPARSRPRVEQDGDRGAREHRPGAVGAHRGRHRPAAAEGQPHQRSEDFMTSRLAAFCLAALLLPALAAGAAGAGAPSLNGCRSKRRFAWPWSTTASCRSRAAGREGGRRRRHRPHPAPAGVRDRSRGVAAVTPVDFAFPRGAFGEFPGTGPIPATDTKVSVPRQPTVYVSSQISQPISQLFAIGLSIQQRRAPAATSSRSARAPSSWRWSTASSASTSRSSRPRARWPPTTRRSRSTASSIARCRCASPSSGAPRRRARRAAAAGASGAREDDDGERAGVAEGAVEPAARPRRSHRLRGRGGVRASRCSTSTCARRRRGRSRAGPTSARRGSTLEQAELDRRIAARRPDPGRQPGGVLHRPTSTSTCCPRTSRPSACR